MVTVGQPVLVNLNGLTGVLGYQSFCERCIHHGQRRRTLRAHDTLRRRSRLSWRVSVQSSRLVHEATRVATSTPRQPQGCVQSRSLCLHGGVPTSTAKYFRGFARLSNKVQVRNGVHDGCRMGRSLGLGSGSGKAAAAGAAVASAVMFLAGCGAPVESSRYVCTRHQGRRGCVEFIGAVNDGKPELVRASTTPATPTFTVTFEANGGTCTMPSQSASNATTQTANTFTKDNRDFEGWAGRGRPGKTAPCTRSTSLRR